MKAVSQKGNIEHINQICSILDSLKEKDVYDDKTGGFSSDKTAIEAIFKMTRDCSLSNIMLRLTVIDSMYSTQMNRRYYALQELAEKLYCLEKIIPLKVRFKQFLLNKYDTHLFDGQCNSEKFNLFSEKYGIGKDGSDKGVAVSLISKYAYFETSYGFPIYDSIVCEMYPRIWSYCGWNKKDLPKLTVKDSNQQIVGDTTIMAFSKGIDKLITLLGVDTSYDHLDRLLWFVGKIYRGNLSLVLNRENYVWCTKNWPCCAYAKNGNFDIAQVDITELPFCKENPRLKMMFELAAELKMNQ